MAGVFFWHNSYKINIETVNSVFSHFEYLNGHYLEMGNWNALVFSKKNYKIQNWQFMTIVLFAFVGHSHIKENFMIVH